MNFTYPVTLTPDPADGGFVVTFPDLPEAITQGDTVEQCLDEAQGALEAAIGYRVREGVSTSPNRGHRPPDKPP